MKRKELQRYLKLKNLDLALFCDPDPVLTYLSQESLSHGLIAVTRTKTYVYTTALDKPSLPKDIIQRSYIREWHKQLKAKRIGINKEALTLSQYQGFRKAFPRASFVDVSSFLKTLRRSKVSQEINNIAHACKITSDAFDALIKELPKQRLRTEFDVAFFLEHYMRSQNCELAFPTISAMGKNAAVPHHKTDNTKLQRGFLLLDFGARYKNYCADMTRVLFLGKPTKAEKEMYQLLLQAQEAGIVFSKPGVDFKQIDGHVRSLLGKHKKAFIHSLGHGVGVEIHEDPFCRQGAKIEEGTIFTIEPGVYFAGKYGLRIEDTLVMLNGKATILTTATKKLVEIARF
ncbi:M24 family metallopeptidase [Candidatus Woesearchaeota archaeon]|nr:M24 family metallopeptidase [Candidatus Woesearchaeota archaeon]